MPRLAALALVLFAVVGCNHVVNEHVVGPHGEDLTELSCVDTAACYDLARQTCGGNYEVVQADAVVSSGTSREHLMISCPRH